MDWIAILKVLGLCLISIIIEVISASKEGKKWFVNLKQPKYSFPFSIWFFIGGLYYVIFGLIAYRQFHTSLVSFTFPVILLILIMLMNGFTNFILFKFRLLKTFYIVLYPFTLLVIGLIIALFQIDKVAVILASIYLIWLSYDLYYFFELWKINNGNNNVIA